MDDKGAKYSRALPNIPVPAGPGSAQQWHEGSPKSRDSAAAARGASDPEDKVIQILRDYSLAGNVDVCKGVLSFLKEGKRSTGTEFPLHLYVPEWIHIKRSPALKKCLVEILQKDGIEIVSFDKPLTVEMYAKAEGHFAEIALDDKLKSVQKCFTDIEARLETQCFKVPEGLHKKALEGLEKSIEYRLCNGTFFKAEHGVFVFVANKESKDKVFDNFCSILHTLLKTNENIMESNPKEKSTFTCPAKGDVGFTVNHPIHRPVSEQSFVFQQVKLEKDLSIFLQNNSAAIRYMTENLAAAAISFDFDNDVTITLTTQDQSLQGKLGEYLSRFLSEKVISLKGEQILRVVSCKDIQHILHRQHQSYPGKLVVLTVEHEDKLRLIGTNDAVTSANDHVKRLLDEYSNVEEQFISVEGIGKLDAVQRQEIESLSKKLRSGIIKVTFLQSPSSNVKLFGNKAACDEFQQKMSRYVADSKETECTLPIQEPQLSFLKEKTAVINYVKDKLARSGVKVEVDINGKRYTCLGLHTAEQKKILAEWHKTYSYILDLDSQDLREAAVKEMKSYFNKCGFLDDSKVLVKLDGDIVTLVTTDDVISAAVECLEKWKMESRGSCHPVDRAKSLSFPNANAEQMLPSNTPKDSGFTSQEPGSAFQAEPVDEIEDELVQENGKDVLKIKLRHPLHPYCKEVHGCQKLVKDEFKRQGFEISMHSNGYEAKVTLSCKDDVTAVRQLLTSFGARVFKTFDEIGCHLSPFQARKMLKEKNHDSEHLIFRLEPGKKSLFLFGNKKILESVQDTLQDILDDYADDKFYLTLTEVEHEEIRKGKLNSLIDAEVKLSTENGLLVVNGPRYVLEEYRFALYKALEKMNEKLQISSDEKKKCYVTLSPLTKLFLEVGKVWKYLLKCFRENGYTIKLDDDMVCFGALSFSALLKAECLMKEIITHKKYALKHEPIIQLESGDDIAEGLKSKQAVFEDRLMAQVDERQILNIVCLSEISEHVESEIKSICDEYIRETIDACDQKLGRITSQYLTSELFEIDHALMGRAKVIVDGRSLMIVTTRDLLKEVEKKTKQLLLKIQAESEINKQNPFVSVDLKPLEQKLLEQPGVLDYINKKIKEEHLQMTFQFGEKFIKVYGLSQTFALAGKTLIESCFKLKEYSFMNDGILEHYRLEEIESMISLQESVHSGRIVIEVDSQKKTLTVVCTDDVFQAVLDKVETIRGTCPGEKVECSREVMAYINKFCSEKLDDIRRNDVTIISTVDKEKGEFEIKGQNAKVKLAKQKVQNLCDEIHIKTFDVDIDQDFDVLNTPQGHQAVQYTESKTKSVVSLRKPEICRPGDDSVLLQPENETVFDDMCSSPTIYIDKRKLLEVQTDVIAIVFTENSLPGMVKDALTHAGVQDQWERFLKRFLKSGKLTVKGTPVKETVYFGDKKLFNCKNIAFCLMPQWEQDGMDKEKERVRDSVKYLLQECSKKSASAVVIVIAVEKSVLFRKISKQILYELKSSLQDFRGPFAMEVSLLCCENCTNELSDIMQKAYSESPSSTTKIKKIIKGTLKSLIKGAGKGGEAKISLEIGALEEQKVDVIVNSVNCDLILHRGGVSKVLNDKTHGELQKECKRKSPKGVRFGEIVITGSHGLPCKSVFHGALKPYDDNENEKPKKETRKKKQPKWELMSTFVHRCLNDASKYKYESIAFPALGTGNLCYPVEEVAARMFRAVENYFTQYPNSSVKNVVFALYEKDNQVIQFFKAEWLAYSYRSSGSQSSVKEERFHPRHDIMIQVLQSDTLNCTGADKILCFWREDDVSDATKHPILGETQVKEWKDIYEPDLREKKVNTIPGGSLFPGKSVINILVDRQSDPRKLLLQAVTMASNSGGYVLQIPLLTPADQPYVQFLANGLYECLSEQIGGCLHVINIVADITNYTPLAKAFQNQQCKEMVPSTKTVWNMLYDGASGWMTETLSYFSMSTSDDQSERKRGALVIAAESESICDTAYRDILQQIKKLVSNQISTEEGCYVVVHEGSSEYVNIDLLKAGGEGEQPFVRSSCSAEINPSYLQNPRWTSVENELKTNYRVEIKDENGAKYISGKFENLLEAYSHLSKFGELPYASAAGNKTKTSSGENIRKRTGDTHTVSCDQLKAAQHLIGHDVFDNYCDIENFPPNQIKIHFLDKGGVGSEVQQRIQGLIQDEMSLNDRDRNRGELIAADAMKGYNDVYVKYQAERNAMLMFAEDWDKMAKAKKRVQLLFGQTKTTSRGGRRFAGSKSAAGVEFDVHKGCAKGRHIQVEVYKADITRLNVEVIVNAANGHLSHGGGVARAIASTAGHALTWESNDVYTKKGEIKVTHLAVTGAGLLPYKKVFHAVGPEWYKYSDKSQCLEDLCHTILRILCEAEKHNITSIAIPSISAAIFAVPKEKCAKMYVRALKNFDLAMDSYTGSLREIHLVDVNDTMVSIILQELEKSWCSQGDEREQTRDHDFIRDCLSLSDSTSLKQSSANPQHAVDQNYGNNPTESKLAQPGIDDLPNGFFKFSDNVCINIFKQDIFQMKADVLISWEDKGLNSYRKLPSEIKRRAGDLYLSERGKHTYAKLGDIIPIAGGKLLQENVFNVVVGNAATVQNFSISLRKMLGQCIKWNKTEILLPVYNQIISEDTRKTKAALFIEAVVDALSDLTRHKNKPSIHVHIVDNQQRKVDELCGILQQYLISLGLTGKALKAQDVDKKHTQNIGGENKCSICLDPMTNPHKLKCGHFFCKGCIDEAFKTKKVCPICKVVCGVLTGNMPEGQMCVTTEKASLPGYSGSNTIVITYSFLDGFQTAEHPNPGFPYKGLKRTAYLPDTAEGQKVLALLKVAWERRLIFTVGRSVTIGGHWDRVTWNEIHHKTNRDGGSSNYGYPDPGYLKRVQEELAAQGVTEKDLGATGTPV